MGAPIRPTSGVTANWLDVVKGEVKVSPREASPEEIQALIEEVIKECRPFLQYLPTLYSMPALPGRIYPSVRFNSPINLGGFTPDTMCLDLGIIEHEDEVATARPGNIIGFNDARILLTRNGVLVQWDLTVRHNEIVSCKFFLLRDDDQLVILRKQPELINQILRLLNSAIQRAISRRELQAMNLRELRGTLDRFQKNLK